MSYAWIIDKDHLSKPGAEPGSWADNAATVSGPREAPDWMFRALDKLKTNAEAGELSAEWAGKICDIYTFNMYDDDEVLYYTGRMITDEGDTEEACYAPLGDFGKPNAGAVVVKYPGHPDMDCEG
jgi:hypothetical protein